MTDTPGPSEPTTYNLLFICSGNTCRSPLAEAIARAAIEKREWRHVRAASAGVSAAAGAPASALAVAVAAEHDIDLAAHRSQPLDPALIDWADLVLCMGPTHLLSAVQLGADEKAAMLTDFRDDDSVGQSIEDPFGGNLDSYRTAYAQIEASVEALLARLEPILSP